MDQKTAAYYNDCIARMEEIFYQECSNMTRSKVEYVGIDFLKGKVKGATVEEIVEAAIKYMKDNGLVEDISYARAGEGILLTLKVKGCTHLGMEAAMKDRARNEGGVQPYTCPIGNMIINRFMDLLKYSMVFVADMSDIDTVGRVCNVKCAVFESKAKVGQVGDWRDKK
jgi:hypothetical protein